MKWTIESMLTRFQICQCKAQFFYKKKVIDFSSTSKENGPLASGYLLEQVVNSAAAFSANWFSISATQFHSIQWFYYQPELGKYETRN